MEYCDQISQILKEPYLTGVVVAASVADVGCMVGSLFCKDKQEDETPGLEDIFNEEEIFGAD